MSKPHNYFAYTLVEKDVDGMITGRLLHTCPTLEVVCAYLKQCSLQPYQVHVCGWDKDGGQWVIPMEEMERAMLGAG
jgi:hypothetical protein